MCWKAIPHLIPLLPASSHPFPSSYFTDSDFPLCTSLSIFLLVSPKQLICPSVLTLFHHVSSPFSHLLLINFILWLPDALLFPLHPLHALPCFSLATSLRSFFFVLTSVRWACYCPFRCQRFSVRVFLSLLCVCACALHLSVSKSGI